MSNIDWYRRHGFGVQQRQAPPSAPPRYVIGEDGRAVPIAPQESYETGRIPVTTPTSDVPLGQRTAHEVIATYRGSKEGHRAGIHKDSRCPHCNSAHYLAIGNTLPRCFDCNYKPPRGGFDAQPNLQDPTRGLVQGVPVAQARNYSNPDAIHNGQIPVGTRITQSGSITPI